MKTLLAAAIAIGTVLLGSSAPAQVITFDGPAYGPAYVISNSTYKAAGYTFSTSHQEAVWIPVNQGADNGTQIFVNGYSPLDIARTDGTDFLFHGLDYGQGLQSGPTDPLAITLNLAGGGTMVYNLTSTQNFQTLHTAPQLVTSVVVGTVSGFVSIDNLIFGVVPEPETWLLMIGGFGLVGAASRRQWRAKAV